MGIHEVGLEPEVEEYGRQLRAWLDEHGAELEPFRAHVPGPIEAALAHQADLQRLLWDSGWSRWGWPEDCGGLGGGVLHRATLYEELALAGVVIPDALTTAEVMGPAMIDYARPLAQAHLADYLRGDEGWCQGFSEPDAGSDMASLRLTAVLDGDVFRVSGQKTWSSLATTARRCFLLARTGEPGSRHRGLSVLFVDVEDPAVTVRGIRAATGRNEFAEIFFDDAVVPRTQLVGELGQGWEIAMSLLQWERGMYGWQRQAILHRRLQELVAACVAQGRPVPPSRVGEVYLTLNALRSQCRGTVRKLAAGDQPGPSISVDKLLLSSAELQFFDMAREVLEPVIELDDEPEAERLREEFFYSRASSIYGGTAEIQRNIIADRVLRLPRDGTDG